MLKTMILTFLLTQFSLVQAKTELMVSAAASLKNAFTEIAANFEKEHPDLKISLNFAASGQLQSQIEMGAPVDIFASASQQEIKALTAKNFIDPASIKIFAHNELVLIKSKNSKLKLYKLHYLKDPSVTKIALGNKESVPAGKYAFQSLEHYKLLKDVEGKLIPCENVRQVLDYVERNEVDAGFVFSTDAIVGKDIEIIEQIAPEAHEKIIYPVSVIKSSRFQKQSLEFIDYILKSKSVLKKYGFKD